MSTPAAQRQGRARRSRSASALLPLLASFALAAPPATATHTVTLTIPYAALLHVDAHQSTTTKLEEGVHVTASIKAPLNLYLHTNAAWRLTITTQDGQHRALAGPHGAHTLTAADLGLQVQDGERVTVTVVRK